MITAATSGENVRSAIAGHADGIIAKPFNTPRLSVKWNAPSRAPKQPEG